MLKMLIWLDLIVLATMLAACSPSGRPQGSDFQGDAAGQRPVKRVIAALVGDPPTLSDVINAKGTVPGLSSVQGMLNVGLVTADQRGSLHPRLAEEVPSIENGQWRLFPDGAMETTWKIRPGAQWHDGASFTTADLVFTLAVASDPDVPFFRDDAQQFIERVQAPDAHSITVRWNRPFVDADQLFATASPTAPLPRHLLEQSFAQDKMAMTQLPYWGPDFIGTGPFKLQQFERSSHVVLVANESYVLGRPKLDEIEVRFITELTAVIANLLAGSIDMTLGRNMSFEQAQQLREQYRVEFAPTSWNAIFPQFLNPSPAVVQNVQFRRALMHAIDRQVIVDSVQGGLGSVAHSLLIPEEPEYRSVEQRIVRYEYDPRKATALIAELGYARGSDGLFRDRANQVLSLELRTLGQGDAINAMLTVADHWQRSGVNAEPLVVPSQRAQDREFRANFPAFDQVGQANDVSRLAALRIAQIPLPSNNLVGENRARYHNPEFDAMIGRFFTTIPKTERAEILAQILHRLSDETIWMGVYHILRPAVISPRLEYVPALGLGGSARQDWNVHEWDLK
jgi:peptide/nickel transport system substrate-binding protein